MCEDNGILPLAQATRDAEMEAKRLRDLRRADIRERVAAGQGVNAVSRMYGISSAAVSQMTSRREA